MKDILSSNNYIIILLHFQFCKSSMVPEFLLFHINTTRCHLLLPSFFPSHPNLVEMWLWEEVTSKAWCWVMWLCPTTLALPSCHNSRFKILTNMAWHPWPSSPIYEPLLFPSLHHLYPISQLSSLLFTSWRCVQWTLPPVPSDTLPSCQNDVPDNEHPKCFSLGCWRLLTSLLQLSIGHFSCAC